MNNSSLVLREKLNERGVEYEAYRDVKNRRITKWRTYHGAFVFFAVEKEGKLFVETASDTEHSAICTPEQAIAATLGSEPDEIELTQTYDAGFRNGVMAVYQQLEGIEDYEELQCFIAEYWGEGEGNDER